ncbi:hypothetical protein [Methylomicrobium sp. Wu6]|uniref:hypothetical protein n=1 Tax=Methylomicrobium sp. Wu6 TaxID=3107928 RepID=UPI002DD65628|nr:hypothetical protein [Methylomicrobium sp. Wu6]MEC4749446.1 hypothetical protein [Methylomicrobium sp. Wu6]
MKLVHACIRIGGSAVMLTDKCPDWGSLMPKSLKGSSLILRIEVVNVDAFVGAGAKITMGLVFT